MNARIPNLETDGMVPEEISGRVIAPGTRDGGVNLAPGTPHDTPQTTTLRTPRPPASGSGPSVSTNSKDHMAARELANLFDQYIRLTRDEHLPATVAASMLGRPASLFCGRDSKLARYVSQGVAALLPARRDGNATASDLTREIEALGWFIPAASFFYMCSNRDAGHGSVPEAVRRAASLPKLPNGWRDETRWRFTRALIKATGEPYDREHLPAFPEHLKNAIVARERAGKPLVPERIARQISRSTALVQHHRNARESKLTNFSAPGSMFFFHDPLTGEYRPPKAGEVIEADDATINFPVCVKWEQGGDPCSEKFGVKVGRFQWLVAIDAARRFVTAWSYIMRPRSSYRAEDALALMRTHCLQHGIPVQWRFEQGVWKSRLVQQAIAGMGAHLHTVHSPRQKPFIEGLFNTLWTKLSVQFPGADVGRFRGETEEANKILTRCRAGHEDPRQHFPTLPQAVAAFQETIAEKNNTPVRSDIGSWVPAEAWAARETGGVRWMEGDMDWIFAPYTRDWQVSGMNVGGRIRLFEDLAVPFDFCADWLIHYKGARVRVHFDPFAPSCRATIVLLESWNGPHGPRRAGDVLGSAKQVNALASYTRMVMGWGDDDMSAGRLAVQQASKAATREMRAVVPSGRGYAGADRHDGVKHIATLEDDGQGNVTLRRGDLTEGEAAPAPAPAIDRAALRREIEALEKENEHLFT